MINALSAIKDGNVEEQIVNVLKKFENLKKTLKHVNRDA